MEIINAISDGSLKQSLGYWHDEEWPEPDLKEAFPVFETMLHENGCDGFNLWLTIEKENNQIIGSAGYIGRPDDEGNIEIGFGIIPGKRGKGFCVESVTPLLKWGFDHDTVKRITARCDKRNRASRKVIGRLGFEPIGEEGDLLIWKLEKRMH